MSGQSVEQSSPIYIDIARHAVKGPLTASTRDVQRQSLAACSIFLLAWLNLVQVKEVELQGFTLVVSLNVIAHLALVYAAYTLVRFLSEATLELRLYELEFEPINASAARAIESEREAQETRATAFWAALEAFDAKIKANTAFIEQRDSQIAQIEARLRPEIDRLKAAAEAFGSPAPGAASGEDLAALRARTDAYEEWYAAEEDLRQQLKPIREQKFPHEDMTEGNSLIPQSMRVYGMPATESIISAWQTARQRAIVVALLDIGLPAILFTACIIVWVFMD